MRNTGTVVGDPLLGDLLGLAVPPFLTGLGIIFRGAKVGPLVGSFDGELVGAGDGDTVGCEEDGGKDGIPLGFPVGSEEGNNVPPILGERDGINVGFMDGEVVSMHT